MSTITNKHGLPQTIVEAIRNDDYDPGESDITVTQLIDPPRKVALVTAHKDELTEDAADRIWALFGKAIHRILQDAGRDALTEERLYVDCLGWKVGGRFDNCTLDEEYDGTWGWTLTDWKATNVYAATHGIKAGWEAQLNLLALLLHEAGFNVTKLRVGAFLRDWIKSKIGNGYPEVQYKTLDIPLWSLERQQVYLGQRVMLHALARVKLPLCTDEERWADPPTWAVLKSGGIRAIKVFDAAGAAQDWCKAQKDRDSLIIQPRSGKSKRCANYCLALQVCEQGKALMATGGATNG